MESIKYIVTQDLDIFSENSVEYKNCTNPLFLIQSTLKRNTIGKGMYQLYFNTVYSNLEEQNEITNFKYHEITCETNWKENWDRYNRHLKSNYAVVIKVNVTDKFGTIRKLNFDQKSFHNLTHERFKDFLNYVKLLNLVGSHEAMDLILKKDWEISVLKRELLKLKN